MKRISVTVLLFFIAFFNAAGASDKGFVNWLENYVEARGEAVVPASRQGTAQGELLAKRGAMLDLQRNMLEIMQGVQVDATTTMKDFEASDSVRTQISGMIRGIQVIDGRFDGETYTLTGRLPLEQIRRAVAPELRRRHSASAAVKTSLRGNGKLTGVIIDARHLPVVPATTFCVRGQKGQVVYSLSQVNYERFLQSGLCQYHDNIQYAKGLVHLGNSFVTVKAVGLANGNVDLVLTNADAARLAGRQPYKNSCALVVVLGE